jgi:hypothetical protein
VNIVASSGIGGVDLAGGGVISGGHGWCSL